MYFCYWCRFPLNIVSKIGQQLTGSIPSKNIAPNEDTRKSRAVSATETYQAEFGPSAGYCLYTWPFLDGYKPRHGYLVSWCFKPSQPRISGLKETIIKSCIVERTNKAEMGAEEQSEKAESCRKNLRNEIQLKGP